MTKDTYNTLEHPVSDILFKDRGSKFFGFAFPVTSEEEIKQHLEAVKVQHHSARHWCYAWQLGTEKVQFRANDDGEPSNSAGMPIYGQIQSFEITDVLIVVVRYFGGVKLGVGGLINAYRTTAKLTLEEGAIIEKTIDQVFEIAFEYKDMNQVMRIVKEYDLQMISQEMHLTCKIKAGIRKSHMERIVRAFEPFYGIKLTLV